MNIRQVPAPEPTKTHQPLGRYIYVEHIQAVRKRVVLESKFWTDHLEDKVEQIKTHPAFDRPYWVHADSGERIHDPELIQRLNQALKDHDDSVNHHKARRYAEKVLHPKRNSADNVIASS